MGKPEKILQIPIISLSPLLIHVSSSTCRRPPHPPHSFKIWTTHSFFQVWMLIWCTKQVLYGCDIGIKYHWVRRRPNILHVSSDVCWIYTITGGLVGCVILYGATGEYMYEWNLMVNLTNSSITSLIDYTQYLGLLNRLPLRIIHNYFIHTEPWNGGNF